MIYIMWNLFVCVDLSNNIIILICSFLLLGISHIMIWSFWIIGWRVLVCVLEFQTSHSLSLIFIYRLCLSSHAVTGSPFHDFNSRRGEKFHGKSHGLSRMCKGKYIRWPKNHITLLQFLCWKGMQKPTVHKIFLSPRDLLQLSKKAPKSDWKRNRFC